MSIASNVSLLPSLSSKPPHSLRTGSPSRPEALYKCILYNTIRTIHPPRLK